MEHWIKLATCNIRSNINLMFIDTAQIPIFDGYCILNNEYVK